MTSNQMKQTHAERIRRLVGAYADTLVSGGRDIFEPLCQLTSAIDALQSERDSLAAEVEALRPDAEAFRTAGRLGISLQFTEGKSYWVDEGSGARRTAATRETIRRAAAQIEGDA